MKDVLIVNPPRLAPLSPELGIACAVRWLNDNKISFDLLDWNIALYQAEKGEVTKQNMIEYVFSQDIYNVDMPYDSYKNIVAFALYRWQRQYLETLDWKWHTSTSLIPSIRHILGMDDGKPVNIEDFVCPDYRLFNFDNYYLHDSIPYFVSIGCAWGKCAFCCRKFNGEQAYQVKSREKIREEMVQLKKENPQCTEFFFFDEFLPLPIAERVMGVMETEPTLRGMTWGCYFRVNKDMTKSFTDRLYGSGCRFCYIGVENSSQRVLKLLNKHDQSADVSVQMVDNLLASGIKPSIFLMTHIPTETPQELKADQEFAEFFRKKGCRTRLYDFFITKHTDFHYNCEKYGINREELEAVFEHNNYRYFTSDVFSNGFPLADMNDARVYKLDFGRWHFGDDDYINPTF